MEVGYLEQPLEIKPKTFSHMKILSNYYLVDVLDLNIKDKGDDGTVLLLK